MFFHKLIILQLLNILSSKGVKSENFERKYDHKIIRNGAIYLNKQHPLWILQDHKDEDEQLVKENQIKEQVKQENFKTFKERKAKKSSVRRENNVKHFHRQKKFKTKAQKRLSKKGVQLPYNYINFKNARKSHLLRDTTRTYINSKFRQNMPVFDAVPGEESFTKSTPIFVYSGNKARMLLNTMLSKEKYPMQEPVPGQVLQPPQSLIFKPKPLIENLQRKLNVTMIPFYAYEAIDPTTHIATGDLFQPAKKYKKAKQYTAFFAPEQVLSQPLNDITQYHYNIEEPPLPPTTLSPPTLQKPFANHRFENAATSSTTASPPHKKLEVTYNGGADKFQITYEDDKVALERPSNVATTRLPTTQPPLTYESYTFENNYYAFPVYTMTKLLENTQPQPDDHRDASLERQRIDKIIDDTLKKENDNLLNSNSMEDTWFILNSRYKGPLKQTTASNRLSSKYVQTSATKALETTTKPTPQPQSDNTFFGLIKAD